MSGTITRSFVAIAAFVTLAGCTSSHPGPAPHRAASTPRAMQVLVGRTCAPDRLSVTVIADDSDLGQRVRLRTGSGPFTSTMVTHGGLTPLYDPLGGEEDASDGHPIRIVVEGSLTSNTQFRTAADGAVWVVGQPHPTGQVSEMLRPCPLQPQRGAS